ncbi:HEAT repeat domain-containing protein [Nanoarchaeota archaeon]
MLSDAERILCRGSDPLPVIEEDLAKLLKSDTPFDRACAALALGQRKERKRFPKLVAILDDKDVYVRGDAITSLAQLGDSRALFVLVNHYSSASFEEQKRVLMAIEHMRDPRATEFLRTVKGDLEDHAKRALAACEGNFNFKYTYTGRPQLYSPSLLLRDDESHIVIHSVEDIQKNGGIFMDDYFRQRPHTYVIVAPGEFRVGGWVTEHVKVAQGKDVLAAGEVRIEPNPWRITYLSNQSNGYLPSPSCFHWVKDALEKTGLEFPDHFEYEHPRNGFNDKEFLDLFRNVRA